MKIDGSDNLFVYSTAGIVYKITPGGTASTYVSGLTTGGGGLALDNNGTGDLFVTDINNSKIDVVPPGGGSFSVFVNNTQGINQPRDIAFDSSGNMYISNGGNNTISRVTFTSPGVLGTVSTYAHLAEFGNAYTLAFDTGDHLFIADGLGSSVKVTTGTNTDPSSEIVYTLTTAPSHGTLFDNGTALSTTPGNNTFTQADVDAGLLTYTRTSASDNANDSFDFSVQDDNGTPATGTFQILVAGTPTLTNPTVANVDGVSASLGATVADSGGSGVPLVKRGILYAKTATNPNPQIGGTGVTEVDDASTSLGAFSENITGLTPATQYSFVGFASNALSTSYTTPVSTFTTLTVTPPTLASPAVTNIGGSTATLGATVTDAGTNAGGVVKRGILYAKTATNSNPQIGGTGVTEVDDTSASLGAFSENITGLVASTQYSFVGFATNAASTGYTTPVSTFTTQGPPTVTSPTSANVTSLAATLGGNVTLANDPNGVTKRGVLFSTTNTNPTLGGSGVTEVDDSAATTGVFADNVAGLAPNTTYYFVAFATNSFGTSYTLVSTFKTLTVNDYFLVTGLGEGTGTLTTAGHAGTVTDPLPVTTLRTAIDTANAYGGTETILFDPSLFTSGPQTITLPTTGNVAAGPSDFGISTTIIIQGPTGSNGLTLANSGNQRLFTVTSTGNLTLDALTLIGGSVQAGKGGNASVGGGGGGAAAMGGAVFNADFRSKLSCLNRTQLCEWTRGAQMPWR